MPIKWDRHSIRAEINRRGESLASLERHYNLPPNILSVALCRPYPKAESYLSRFLKVPASKLFAYRIDAKIKRRTQQSKDTRTTPVVDSQKRHVEIGMGNVA